MAFERTNPCLLFVERYSSMGSWAPTHPAGYAKNARSWPFFTWVISQVCFCNEHPPGVRYCIPLGKQAGLLTAGYKNSRFPKLDVSQPQHKPIWPMALTQWTWETRETDAVLIPRLPALQWITKSSVWPGSLMLASIYEMVLANLLKCKQGKIKS